MCEDIAIGFDTRSKDELTLNFSRRILESTPTVDIIAICSGGFPGHLLVLYLVGQKGVILGLSSHPLADDRAFIPETKNPRSHSMQCPFYMCNLLACGSKSTIKLWCLLGDVKEVDSNRRSAKKICQNLDLLTTLFNTGWLYNEIEWDLDQSRHVWRELCFMSCTKCVFGRGDAAFCFLTYGRVSLWNPSMTVWPCIFGMQRSATERKTFHPRQIQMNFGQVSMNPTAQ